MKRFSKGFSLIELMIAVAIIGLLAATALPSFSKYKRNAKKAEAYVITRNIINAQKSFYVENQRFATDGLMGAALLGTMLMNYGTGYTYSDFMASLWDELGSPIANGAKVKWFYQAGHGSFDTTGARTSGLDTDSPIVNINADGNSSCAGGLGSGSSSVSPTDFGAPAAPTSKYDFGTSVAFSPLSGRLETSDIWLTQECYYVIQYIFVDTSTGGSFSESPLIEFGITN